MKISKIYFDMDNVLADFKRGIRDLCGLEPPDQEKADPATVRRVWESVRDTEHFYDRLEMVPGAAEMFRLVNEKYCGCCEILTAMPKPKRVIVTAKEDKIHWVRRMLSEDIPVNVVYKEEKKDFCTGKDCILIDDYLRNIEEWETNGGTGILFRNADDAMKKLKVLESGGNED